MPSIRRQQNYKSVKRTSLCGRRVYKTWQGLDRHEKGCKRCRRMAEEEHDRLRREQLTSEFNRRKALRHMTTFEMFLQDKIADADRRNRRVLREMAAIRGRAASFERIAKEHDDKVAEEKAERLARDNWRAG